MSRRKEWKNKKRIKLSFNKHKQTPKKEKMLREAGNNLKFDKIAAFVRAKDIDPLGQPSHGR